jgi:hypothetical protein
MVWVTPVPPVTAAMRSSQTAVGYCATLVIWAPRVPPLAAPAVVTSSRQSGLMKPTALAYGLSTCSPEGGGTLLLVEALGLSDWLGEDDADRDGLADEDDGDADADCDGLVDGLADEAVGLAVTVPPLQTAPFSVKDAGTGLLLVHAPLKPMVAEALVPSAPFQVMLATVTFRPDCDQVPLQPLVTAWPLAGKVKARFQLVMAAPRLVMMTLPVKPPGHWLCTV